MKLFIATIILLVTFTAPTLAGTMEDEILLPSAKVTVTNGAGSATAFKTDKVLGTFLITSLHVVKKQTNIKVTFWHETESHEAYIYSYDEKNDIAILVTPYQAKRVATLGDDTDVDTFDEVYCVGNAIAQGLVVSKGIISDDDFLAPNGRRFYRSDCKIIFGNSGGGMFTKRGEHWVYVGTPDIVLGIPPKRFMGSVQYMPHLGLMTRITDITHHLRFYRIVPEYANP